MPTDVFGYGSDITSIDDSQDVKDHNDVTSINDNNNQQIDGNNGNGDNNQQDSQTDNVTYETGTVLEVGDSKYSIDENGNAVDEEGNVFKQKDEIAEWLKSFEEITEDGADISLSSIQEALGIEIKDENDKAVEFENTVDGIKSYVNAVIESKREEHYDTAVNTLFQRYPIIEDVLNYYLANGNSLKGFGEVPDRSNITIDENNEAQQIHIIKTAWSEQNRKGDVDNYIQYLKSSGILYAAAKEELEGLQESDKAYKQQLAEEAERQETEYIKQLEQYWNGVHDVIKTRNICGYQIPETIVITRNGQKLSATPEDFFNYIYKVDNNGQSAYQKELAKETPESKRDDEILRAYLKFVGGSYSNLVDMAINKQNVNTLKFKAAQKTTNKVRVTKPNTTNKNKNLDLGY